MGCVFQAKKKKDQERIVRFIQKHIIIVELKNHTKILK